MKFTREDLLDENGDLLDITAILDVVNGGVEPEHVTTTATHTASDPAYHIQVPEGYAITYELPTYAIIEHLTNLLYRTQFYGEEPRGLVLNFRDYRSLQREAAGRANTPGLTSLTEFMGVKLFHGPENIEPTLIYDRPVIFPTESGG